MDRPQVQPRLRYTLLLVALLGAILGSDPAPAAAETVWVCHPERTPNACSGPLTTTVRDEGQPDRIVERRPARNPKVDCFYVYPTVSDQPTLNADRSIDEQVEGITRLQANYYSRRCAVYAPVYRQVTVPALLTRSNEELIEGFRVAYPDIRDAWRDYWQNHNRGRRPFILIGHSQGAAMLIELVSEEIDRDPEVRKLMLSAQILGVLPTVPAGERVGGIFKRIPTCGKRRLLGCVIGWATYDETPPDDTRFGVPPTRLAEAFGWDIGPGDEVICSNPGRLKGRSGLLRTLVRSEIFPGSVGLALRGLYQLQPPEAETPWIRMPDRYRGRCEHDNGAHVLRVRPQGDARDYFASPDDTWGLHLIDINIALGNIDKIVRAQKRKWRRAEKRG